MENDKEYVGIINIESVFSDNDKHRFILRRKYVSERKMLKDKKLVFILMNPSYADELLFDKTNQLASNIGVRREFNEVVILNIFSLVTKDKKTLKKHLDHANHIHNDIHISNEVKNANMVIISWGIDAFLNDRISKVKQIIKDTGIDRETVYSIYYKNKNEKIYNPAHLSMYINDTPPNYTLTPYDLT